MNPFASKRGGVLFYKKILIYELPINYFIVTINCNITILALRG